LSVVVSIHQPNYLPWLGYFHKMSFSDIFVFLDSVQYSPKTYTNRCYVIFNRSKTRLSIPIQLKHSSATIREVEIDTANFAYKHLETFRHAYGKSPYFKEVIEILKPHYEVGKTNLADFNMGLIKNISAYIKFSPRFIKLSNLQINSKKNRLLIDITQQCGAGLFVSGVGAKKYIEGYEYMYIQNGITLAYQNFVHPEYQQRSRPFISGCSIIDLAFNTGKNGYNILTRQEEPSYECFKKDDRIGL